MSLCDEGDDPNNNVFVEGDILLGGCILGKVPLHIFIAVR